MQKEEIKCLFTNMKLLPYLKKQIPFLASVLSLLLREGEKMRVLLLSPHPDDVELGAGGTTIKLIKQGHEVKWIVFSTRKDTVLPKERSENTSKREFLEVVKKAGVKDYEIWDFKDKMLHEERQKILDRLYNLNRTFKPNLVIGPSLNDLHQDHKQVAQEMIRAFKKDASVLSYEEPWNNINFEQRVFSILTEEEVNKKWELLLSYKTQFKLKKNYFTKEFIMGLARTRGTQVNSEFAEAFEVLRWRI